jgi:hypothetical protein
MVGLLLLSTLWGVITLVSAWQHSSAAGDVVTTSEPLSVDAQEIYRSLSDADATATSAFLAGGLEPAGSRQRYNADLADAATRIEMVSASAGHSKAGPDLTKLTKDLPVYSGFVESARANNRQGFPVAASYLRQATGLMRSEMLPAARAVYNDENGRLADSDHRATAIPWIVVLAMIAVGVALFMTQRRLSQRFNRTFSPGLLLGTVAFGVSLIWILAALTFAHIDLSHARSRGSAPVETLAQARISALRARGDESLTLADRGGDDAFEAEFKSIEPTLTKSLSQAASKAPASAADSVNKAKNDAQAWFGDHRQVRRLDDGGQYTSAVALATKGAPAVDFAKLDSDIGTAITQEQKLFRSSAGAGRDDFTGLEIGMVVLAIALGAGAVVGVNRRLAEY